MTALWFRNGSILENARSLSVSGVGTTTTIVEKKAVDLTLQYRSAEEIAKHRRPPKNIWDMIFMPLGIAVAYYFFSLPIVTLRRISMPADAFLASGASELSLLLFILGVGFVALGPGMILSNFVQWAIPFLKAQQDRLNQGHGDRILKQATKDLLKFSIPIFFCVYPLCFLGGLNYYALTPDGVVYRPWFAIRPVHYEWRQIKEIDTACYVGSKRSPNGQYNLIFEDGRKIDLNAFSTRDFFSNYSTVSKLLNGVPFSFHFDEQTSKSCPQSWLPYFQKRP